MKYKNYHHERMKLGDLLALDRTRLANERTLLAYLRLAIMIAVSAVSILKLLPQDPTLVLIAWAMLPFALFLTVIGAVRSRRLARSLQELEANADFVRHDTHDRR